MSEFSQRWLDRVAVVAAATYSPSAGLPNFGPAIDLGTSPILGSRPQAFEDSVNSIQFVTDDKYDSQQQIRQETEPELSADEMEQYRELEEKRQRLEEVEAEIKRLNDQAGYDEESGKGDFSWDLLAKLADLDLEKDKLRKEVGDPGAEKNVLGQMIDGLSGVDEQTGLNRTERNWLRAQAEQDSQIKGVLGMNITQQDAELLPELRGAAEEALKTGEWTPDLEEAYGQYQGKDFTKSAGDALEWAEREVVSPAKRGISTFIQVAGQVKEDENSFADDPGALFDADNWREAWERSESVSLGQAYTDRFAMAREEREDAYEAGFDEYGNPIDKNYAQLRQSNVYNIASGATDFIVGWYADPLVIGGKGISVTRSIAKHDLTRMPTPVRNRVVHIASAPADRFDEVAAGIGRHDLIGQYAVRTRRKMDEITTNIRKDPKTHTESWLIEHVPAFKNDYAAASLYRESALRQVRQYDATTGKYAPTLMDDGSTVWDDGLHDATRATMLGNGHARAELSRDMELEDLQRATEQDKLDGVNDWIQSMKSYEDRVRADLSGRQTVGERFSEIFEARRSIDEGVERAKMIQGQLDQYDSWHRFASNVLDAADVSKLRQAQFKTVKPKGNRITHHYFRPSKASDLGVTVTRVPRAAWMKRSHQVDLSGHGSLQEQAPRVLNELAKATSGSKIPGQQNLDVLTEVALERGFGSWEELRRGLLDRASRARTDTERLGAIQRIENIGVEAVAKKHGLTPEQAARTLGFINNKRSDVIRNAIRQADELKAAGLTDEDMFRYVYAEQNDLDIADLPISATQLRNTFIPIDLRQFDRFLRFYAPTVKNTLRARAARGRDVLANAAEVFHSFWKPLVLLRLGYPVRTLSDEHARILAHTASMTTLLEGFKGGLKGLANTGAVRPANYGLRHFPGLEKMRGKQVPQFTHTAQGFRPMNVDGFQFPSAFQPGSGDYMLALNSSGNSVGGLLKSYQGNLNTLRKYNFNVRRTGIDEPGHPEAWAHVLNSRVQAEPIWLKMLAGETDEEIVRWVRRTGAGRQEARRVGKNATDPETWIEAMRNEFDVLVTDDALRVKLLNKQKVTTEELQQRIIQGDNAPVTLDESGLDLLTGRGAAVEWMNNQRDRLFNTLATMPSDLLARNPFFNWNYKRELERMVSDLPKGYELSEKAAASFAKASREFALKQTKRYLFNIDQTDLVHGLRHLFPFMGAWQETMRAYGRIFTENPESFVRLGVNGWMDMDEFMFIEMVDQQGRNANDPDHGELDTAVTMMPKGILKALDPILPGDQAKAAEFLAPGSGVVPMPLNKQTLSTALQGQPFWLPGAGPMVQFAGSTKLKDMPWMADENAFTSFMHKWLFPVGVPSSGWDAVKSTLWRRVERQAEGLEDPVFTNAADNYLKTMYYRELSAGRQPTTRDIKKMRREAEQIANATQAFYVLGALGSPFSFSLETDTQFFIDMAHQYQDEFGFDKGYKKYLAEFGDDAYLFWHSNSQNVSGVPPTSSGFKGYKKHQRLVDDNPDIGQAIVGMNTQDDEFNYAAYARELDTGLRKRLPPEEALSKAQSGEGWQQYRQISKTIETELQARGLTSLNQKEAADLAQMKRLAIVQLREKFPGWSREYDQFDKGRSYEIVQQFRNVASDPKGPQTMAWEGVAEFVSIWDALAAELDARRELGGSANIEVEDNADLKELYDTAVGNLVGSNLEFEEIYYRYLESASLTDGSHGQLTE